VIWDDGQTIIKNSKTIHNNIYNSCPDIPNNVGPYDIDPITGLPWILVDRSQTQGRIASSGKAITNVAQTLSPVPTTPGDLANKVANNLGKKLLMSK
jgi:hypothetical protein